MNITAPNYFSFTPELPWWNHGNKTTAGDGGETNGSGLSAVFGSTSVNCMTVMNVH